MLFPLNIYPEVGLPNHVIVPFLIFLRNHHSLSHNGCTESPSSQQWMKAPFSAHFQGNAVRYHVTPVRLAVTFVFLTWDHTSPVWTQYIYQSHQNPQPGRQWKCTDYSPNPALVTQWMLCHFLCLASLCSGWHFPVLLRHELCPEPWSL